MRKLPSAAYLRERLSYNPSTGVLTWNVIEQTGDDVPNTKRFNTRFAGNQAGTRRDGYRIVAIDGTQYYSHRVIWKMMTGAEPAILDHKDNDGMNNRWSNLRSASARQNAWNSKISAANTSGYKGVSYRTDYQRPTWRAYIRINGKPVGLGNFHDPLAAAAAYAAAAKVERGEFARIK